LKIVCDYTDDAITDEITDEITDDEITDDAITDEIDVANLIFTKFNL
jgi:hypothetical protein